MENVIESVANGLGGGIGLLAESGVLFVIFALLWIGFAVGLAASQESVDAAWAWVQGLPLVLQGVLWVLFLPVMLGLWIWQTTWPLVLRVILVVSVAGWNLFVFLPRWLSGAPR